jgi:hypothetical protein
LENFGSEDLTVSTSLVMKSTINIDVFGVTGMGFASSTGTTCGKVNPHKIKNYNRKHKYQLCKTC